MEVASDSVWATLAGKARHVVRPQAGPPRRRRSHRWRDDDRAGLRTRHDSLARHPPLDHSHPKEPHDATGQGPQLLHLPRRLRRRRAAVAGAPVRPCRRAAARVDVRHPLLGQRAAARGSTTLRRPQRASASARRSWAPTSSARPDGRTTRTGGAGGDPNPPFHTPTYVLTHRPRPPLEMEGGTTFHFLDASPAEALAVARRRAGDLDVRIGGGATTVRDFVAAGLVDHLHLVRCRSCSAVAPGCGTASRRSRTPTTIEAVSSPSGVTHLTFTGRRPPPERPYPRRSGRWGDFGGPLTAPVCSPALPSGLFWPGGGVWRSLVARVVRDDEAAGSNPVTPTTGAPGPSHLGPGVPFRADVVALFAAWQTRASPTDVPPWRCRPSRCGARRRRPRRHLTTPARATPARPQPVTVSEQEAEPGLAPHPSHRASAAALRRRRSRCPPCRHPGSGLTGVVVGGLAVLCVAGRVRLRGRTRHHGVRRRPRHPDPRGGADRPGVRRRPAAPALGVPHADSTSLLAVGILAVLVLVFLLDSLDEGWMVIAIPLVAVLLRRARGGSPQRSWTTSDAPETDARGARTSARGGDQLRDLHGVEGGALAQVVVADEERETAVAGDARVRRSRPT